jgi:hypothetical protein
MTPPTQKQINDFYKSRATYEKKLDEAMNTAPRIEELSRLVGELINSNSKLQMIVETQTKSIDKLMCGYERLNTDVELLKQANSFEGKKLEMPTAVLLAIIGIIIGGIVGIIIEHFGEII